MHNHKLNTQKLTCSAKQSLHIQLLLTSQNISASTMCQQFQKINSTTQTLNILNVNRIFDNQNLLKQQKAHEVQIPSSILQITFTKGEPMARVHVLKKNVRAFPFLVHLSHLTTNDQIEEAKKIAAYTCVKNHVQSGQVIGVGTGSTVVYVAKCLGEMYLKKQLEQIVCIPTSYQARTLILQNGLPLGDLELYPVLDLCIDGADEVDENLNCIKGGGACLTQEKIVINSSKYFYVVADSRKISKKLGDNWRHIPIEVVPMAYMPVRRTIEKTLGGTCNLRMAVRKAGPVVTDNANFVLDWIFPKIDKNVDWISIHNTIKLIVGVVETGLFIRLAQKAYFGKENGEVCEMSANEERLINRLPFPSEFQQNGSIVP
ncbi:Ribose-5-phosphate isomerase [Trichinella spiralis]|uniref:ribose-5-phosphate isomerase n=1 Tax=Trichinella spiralis TaxID=6334 RepID=A0A0V1C0G5_TRISP|nr:Ribose-5-phosphate isomerase [Trichinella spiralis]